LARGLSKHYSLNSAKSYIGKQVNIRLLNGEVLVNVKLEGIENRLLCIHANKPRAKTVYQPLDEVAEFVDVAFEAKLLGEGF
jgi:hypothetical protein